MKDSNEISDWLDQYGNPEIEKKVQEKLKKINTMEKSRFKEVCVLDICFPDYFTGYHLPVLAVSVWHGITNEEVSNGIKEEVSSIYDLLIESFNEAEINMFDAYADKIRGESGQVISIEQEEEQEEEEQIYMYLSLCNPVYSNGIWFLNP